MITTLEQAEQANLDVYLLPPNRRDLIENLLTVFNGIGREAIEFPVEIAHFPLTAVAVKQAPGKIAPQMKKRKKTVMEFIHAE